MDQPPYTQEELEDIWRRWGGGPVAFTGHGFAATPAPAQPPAALGDPRYANR